jgi:hypothetical protein
MQDALVDRWGFACDLADHCHEVGDHASGMEWAAIRDSLDRVMSHRTVDTLRIEPLARLQVHRLTKRSDYRTDRNRPSIKAMDIVRDLCRAGHFKIYDAATNRDTKPRTLRVDGTLYDIDAVAACVGGAA